MSTQSETDARLARTGTVMTGETARSVSNDIAQEPPNGRPSHMYVCGVNSCERQFKTTRGLSQHQRRAHPEHYHAKGVVNVEGR